MAAPLRNLGVISSAVVFVIAVCQLALIGGVVWLLFATNDRKRSETRAEAAAQAALGEPLRAFLIRGESPARLALALSRLRRSVAARQLQRIGGTLLAPEQLRALAVLVRKDAWVGRTLKRGTSRWWWKRMEAARLLTMVYGERDRALLEKLVMDDEPAVASAAAAALSAHADAALVEEVIRNFHRFPRTVRLRQMHCLRSHAGIASPLLLHALDRASSADELKMMVEFAEILGTPSVLTAIIPLATHPDPDVRANVARALRAAFVPGAVETAELLMNDTDWHVRAAAARALEGLNATAAIPALGEALGDAQWWVRYRAGVALSGLGELGRVALEDAVVGDDVLASEMAIAVGDLSDANRLDLGG